MRKTLSPVLSLRQLRYTSFCLVAVLLITGWCRAAEVPSVQGEDDSRAIEDPALQAPPLPREGNIPPNSRLYNNLTLEEDDWNVLIEDDASDAEVSRSAVHTYVGLSFVVVVL